MINRGRRDGLYLYEVTEQDLVLITDTDDHYAIGNILIFVDKKEISLGREVARADDFDAAVEYLDNADDGIGDRCKLLENTIARQQEELAQRDDLLSELSNDLDSQKYSNQVLIAQLEQVRSQIEVERLSKEEVVGDLQQVSAETHSLDAELAKTIDAKLSLEQELAARITDLIELDLQNEELKRSLRNLPETEPLPIAAPNSEVPKGTDGEVLTMASGKQIHIYHDFPAPPKNTGFFLFGSNFSRVIMILIIVLIIVGAASMIATARINGISLGESLDLLLRSLGS